MPVARVARGARHAGSCTLAIVLAACGGGGQDDGPAVGRETCGDAIGCGNVYLMVDETAFDTSAGLTRELGVMTKDQPTPLIAGQRFYGSALPDAQGVRLYTYGGDVWTAADGLAFTRTGVINGIPFGDGEQSMAVSRTDDLPDSQRYLAAFSTPSVEAGIAISSDGLSFTALNGGAPVTGRASDTYDQLLFDPVRGQYRLNTRTDFGDAGGSGEIRGVRTMVNSDIVGTPTAWTTISEWSLTPWFEPTDRQIYAKTEFVYRGVYFGLATVYSGIGDMSEGPVDYVTRHERNVLDAYLLTSRNGIDWDLHWILAGQPLVARGASGTFDKDAILPAAQVVTTGGKHVLYYSGADERHDVPARNWGIGRATVQQDRLVCQAARGGPGTAQTAFLPISQSSFGIDVSAAHGSVTLQFEKRSVDGNTQSGTPISISSRDSVMRVPFDQIFTSRVLQTDVVRVHLQLDNAAVCALAL